MSEPTSKENTIILKYPVKLGSMDEVKVLNFSRIKGKHLRGFNMTNPSMDDLMELAEKLTMQTTSFFDELDGVDVMKVLEKVGNLLESSPVTGNSH